WLGEGRCLGVEGGVGGGCDRGQGGRKHSFDGRAAVGPCADSRGDLCRRFTAALGGVRARSVQHTYSDRNDTSGTDRGFCHLIDSVIRFLSGRKASRPSAV